MIIRKKQNASTLLVTLFTILVLAIIAGSVFDSLNTRHFASYHSSSWEEALNAAESGADYAMNTINTAATSGTSAWAGWAPTTGTFPETYSGSIPSHSGDGNQKMYFSVTIDSPITSNGQPWYRIRSVGTAELPGPKRISYEHSLLDINNIKNHKTMLRGLSYATDRTGGYCHLPQASRSIEVIASPVTGNPFMHAIAAVNSIQMSGGAYVDSFNSSNSSQSTNGVYDPAKRLTSGGNVASDASGNQSNLGNNSVYGNASSNGGVFQNDKGVTGTVYNNFNTTFPAVNTPSWSTVNASPNQINLSGNNTATMTSGTGATAANYQLSSLQLSGGSSLTFVNPTPGQTSHINIWITGTLQESGNSTIIQQSGVIVTIYVQGAVNISGAGVQNQNNVASDLMLYGVTPSNGSNPQFQLSGQSTFIGAVYAPAFQFQMSGQSSFSGSVVANSVQMSGQAGFHYDQALGSASTTAGSISYQMASWVEDIRWW